VVDFSHDFLVLLPASFQVEPNPDGKKAAGAVPSTGKKDVPSKASRKVTKASDSTGMGSLVPPWMLRPVSTVPDYYHYIAVGVLTAIALALRFYKLEYPDEIVFDEIYFAGFASHYIKREHFFDSMESIFNLSLFFLFHRGRPLHVF
jgi:dolichyl-phosphate-mannose-protein mannosyltransferase